MASEEVKEAIANLRQALIDDGMDEGTADAFLNAATPNEVNLVGNFADLNRLGALVASGQASGGAAVDQAIADHLPASPAPGVEGGVITNTAAAPATGNGNGDDLNLLTKADLQAMADEQGVEYTTADTKADLVAKLGG